MTADSDWYTLVPEGESLKNSLPAVYQAFTQAAPMVLARLSPEEYKDWFNTGMDIAHSSFRSWEAAVEYFTSSPQLLSHLTLPQLTQWAHRGKSLAESSSDVAAAYFRSSPQTVPALATYQIGLWAGLGESLYRGEWQSGSLAISFFESSAKLLLHLTYNELDKVARLMVPLIDAGAHTMARRCLETCLDSLPKLEKSMRSPILDLGYPVMAKNPTAALLLFNEAPQALMRIKQEERLTLIDLAQRVARDHPDAASSFLLEGSRALARIENPIHAHVMGLADGFVELSHQAALEFIKSVPTILKRIRVADLDEWCQRGTVLLQARLEAGLNFFRVESAQAEDFLTDLSRGVELSQVGEVLHLYCKALTGSSVEVMALESLTKKGIGWTSERSPTTEGSNIYLPTYIQEYANKDENFACYKVYATHQAGHLEFDSFAFRFEKVGGVFPLRRVGIEELLGHGGKAITDMERFLDMFQDRRLASDIFALVEDTRVDYMIRWHYAGIRSALSRIQRDEASRRPSVQDVPLREAFLEGILQWTINNATTILLPSVYHLHFQTALAILRMVLNPHATVEDATEATLQLYIVLSRVPNLASGRFLWEEWAPVDTSLSTSTTPEEMIANLMSVSSDIEGMAALLGHKVEPSDGEEDYHAITDLDFRGDFKPELVQVLMKLKTTEQDGAGQQPMSPLSPEDLKGLLEKLEGTEVSEFYIDDLDTTSGMFITNLMKEAAQATPKGQAPVIKGSREGADEADETPMVAKEPATFLYDEWNYRANDYRRDWCLLKEIVPEEGYSGFYEETLKKYSKLAHEVRRQFEMLRPEMFKKIKRLTDGEDFNLDDVIEFLVEKRAGTTPPDKLYWRRNKEERSVAMAFLLDMSASTDEDVVKDTEPAQDLNFDDPTNFLIFYDRLRAPDKPKKPRRRIIDVEKESLVLLIQALETVGDTYGVYGFSGYGRDDVEFFVIKDMDENLTERVRSRIDKIEPVRGTRMGAAIRHAIAKLDAQDARIKVLFLLSDGRPQDHDYGRDRTEKEYAIRDTHKALTEAKRRQIIPFCLTVDPNGSDYLKAMCGDLGYEMVDNIESLPSLLPTLYRMLTN